MQPPAAPRELSPCPVITEKASPPRGSPTAAWGHQNFPQTDATRHPPANAAPPTTAAREPGSHGALWGHIAAQRTQSRSCNQGHEFATKTPLQDFPWICTFPRLFSEHMQTPCELQDPQNATSLAPTTCGVARLPLPDPPNRTFYTQYCLRGSLGCLRLMPARQRGQPSSPHTTGDGRPGRHGPHQA